MEILIMGAIQIGLLHAIMAIGIYITFRILGLPDLTVDGSFTLGMAITAILTTNGHPFLAIFVAFLFGVMAGLTTGFLQTKMGIHPILSGILVMTSLYSINLFIMKGKANISLMGSSTIFQNIEQVLQLDSDLTRLLIGIFTCLILTILLSILFKTRLGLAIRATGDNEEMVRSSSINANVTKCIGLALGNGLVALSGGLVSQYYMYADISSGTGMVVIGLASVIIGEVFLGKRSVFIGFLSAIIGSSMYWLIIALALRIELLPAYGLKLISSFIVTFALVLPSIKNNIKLAKIRKGSNNV